MSTNNYIRCFDSLIVGSDSKVSQLTEKMRSFSTSNICSYYLKCFYLHMLCVLLNFAIAKGFNPPIRLPTSELYTNISRTLILYIDDFGAKGDGFTDDTESLQSAWKVACSSSSGAKIIIPAGIFSIRPIDFAGPCLSKVALRVSGLIVAPRDPSVWEGLDPHKWLYFHGVARLKVDGGGIIDGSGKEWWTRSCKTNNSNPCTRAPTALTFDRCRNLRVENITIFNGQQIHLAFTHCRHVVASHVTIISPAYSPNTDGIHISASMHVVLNDTAIRTGDDCISIASNSSQIYIKNAFCGAGRGISIGSLGRNNAYAWVEDVVVNGAALLDTENGVRITTWQGGSGFVRKITFENIWMQNVSNPITINQYYCESPVICANQTSAVKIESVSFRSISGTYAAEDAVKLACSDSYPCKRIYMENVELTALSGTERSFCWEAYGTSSGPVHPPPCISSGDIIIRHPVNSNSSTSLLYNFGLIST